MSRFYIGLGWVAIGGITATALWVTVPWNTVFALGVLAGVAVGGLRTATSHLSGVTLPTAVVTLSTGVIAGAVTVAVISAVWLPAISTATLGYAIGIVATWLLVSGVSLDELGSFAAIGGLLLAVVGGGGGLLWVDEPMVLLTMLFSGLVAGLLVPFSGLSYALLRTKSGRGSDDATMNPATRFGIEAAVIAGLAVSVPFGSRAVALFGYGGLDTLPIGIGCGALLSVGVWRLAGGNAERLARLRDRFVERVYRLVDRVDNWVERRRRDATAAVGESSADGDGGGEREAVAGDDEGAIETVTSLVDGIADRLIDHGLVIDVAEELETFVEANSGVQNRLSRLWDRLGGAVARKSRVTGAALQLSAATEADSEGDTERARSLTDAALELAAPTIGSVAAAIVRGRRENVEGILDRLAPLFARIESLLNEEGLIDDPDDPEGYHLIRRLLERLVAEQTGEGFDTALSTIRAAAADGWYSVQAGDGALESEDYQRALRAYMAAIDAYRRAYDVAIDARKTAAADRREPDSDEEIDETDRTATAEASTYAAEATRIGTALEAVLHDTAAVTAAAVDDLYGEEPPPTVDTEARRRIVRCLRALRQTRQRIDATVPPIDLADDRYQRAEIARSLARLRPHLQSADETARSGNVEAAAEQYDRVADRLDVLSDRAGTAGLTALSRSLVSTAAAIGQLAAEPTPEAIADRPQLPVPSTENLRLPEVAPVARRLRRTFCDPAFLDLMTFTLDAGDHPVLDIAGEPYAELLGSAGLSLSGLDPIYTQPDVDSLREWVDEIAVEALSAAVETVADRHEHLREVEPPAPPAFREPPEAVREGAVGTVSTAEGITAFGEVWLARASELVTAEETIDRRYAAVDGFAALEARIRETLNETGSVDTDRVSPELLRVAAFHLTGVEYDSERQLLSKTGSIARRTPEAWGDDAEAIDRTDTGTADSSGDDSKPETNGRSDTVNERPEPTE